MKLLVPEETYRRRLERMREMIDMNAPAIMIWTEAGLIRKAHKNPYTLLNRIRFWFAVRWGI